MKPTYEELEAENRRLRAKLSPLEDKDFTEEVKVALAGAALLVDDYVMKIRGVECLVYRPSELWEVLFTEEPSTSAYAKLGRSLQALGWERSAKHGNLVFVLPVEEYKSGRP